MANNATTTNVPERAFRKGLREIKVGDNAAVREELAAALGVTTRQSLRAYADGTRILDVEKAARVESVFRKYGVDACWGK